MQIFPLLHHPYQLKAYPSFGRRPKSGIKATLFLGCTFKIEFVFNLMSNIIRIYYFRKIFESFLAMATPKLYYSCLVINSYWNRNSQGACRCPHNLPKIVCSPMVSFSPRRINLSNGVKVWLRFLA